jgi:hypothetical protein
VCSSDLSHFLGVSEPRSGSAGTGSSESSSKTAVSGRNARAQ